MNHREAGTLVAIFSVGGILLNLIFSETHSLADLAHAAAFGAVAAGTVVAIGS